MGVASHLIWQFFIGHTAVTAQVAISNFIGTKLKLEAVELK